MTQPTDNPNLVEAAADLGRRDTDRALEPYGLDGDTRCSSPASATTSRSWSRTWKRYLTAPNRSRGSVAIHDPADFALYVKRIADPDTTPRVADIDKGTVTALLDDHGARRARGGGRTPCASTSSPTRTGTPGSGTTTRC
jgi:hypothetical protein